MNSFLQPDLHFFIPLNARAVYKRLEKIEGNPNKNWFRNLQKTESGFRIEYWIDPERGNFKVIEGVLDEGEEGSFVHLKSGLPKNWWMMPTVMAFFIALGSFTLPFSPEVGKVILLIGGGIGALLVGLQWPTFREGNKELMEEMEGTPGQAGLEDQEHLF